MHMLFSVDLYNAKSTYTQIVDVVSNSSRLVSALLWQFAIWKKNDQNDQNDLVAWEELRTGGNWHEPLYTARTRSQLQTTEG